MIVTVTIQKVIQDFPPPVPEPGLWHFTVESIDGPIDAQNSETETITFDLGAGLYTFKGQRLDVTGQPLGPEVSADLEVPDESVGIEVAGGITVVLSA